MQASSRSADLAPKLYSVVLTDESGQRLYGSCLSFLDAIPGGLAARHEHLQGAYATKVLCLLSKQPYLTSMEQVLRRLYTATFCTGPSAPVADLVVHVLRVPSPAAVHGQVRFELEGRPFHLHPLGSTGWPPHEVSSRPLLESLPPGPLALAFLAALLERRVLLVCAQLRTLTLAAEGLRLLLWPFRYQHVYVPLMPSSLEDLLEAPTPFLMGITHGAAQAAAVRGSVSGGLPSCAGGGAAAAAGGGGDVAAALAAARGEGLVVVDLDRGVVHNASDLQTCVQHPAVLQLQARLSALLRPSSHVEPVGAPPAGPQQTAQGPTAAGQPGVCGREPPPPSPGSSSRTGVQAAAAIDPWVAHARMLALQGWGPPHEAFVRRLFLQLFAALLRGFHQHVPACGLQPGGGSSPAGDSRSSPAPFLPSAMLRAHVAQLGASAHPLMSQLLQTQGFYAFVEEHGRSDAAYEWYHAACQECRWEPERASPAADSAACAGAGAASAPMQQHTLEAAGPALTVRPYQPSVLALEGAAPTYSTFPSLCVSDEEVVMRAADAAAEPCTADGQAQPPPTSAGPCCIRPGVVLGRRARATVVRPSVRPAVAMRRSYSGDSLGELVRVRARATSANGGPGAIQALTLADDGPAALPPQSAAQYGTASTPQLPLPPAAPRPSYTYSPGTAAQARVGSFVSAVPPPGQVPGQQSFDRASSNSSLQHAGSRSTLNEYYACEADLVRRQIAVMAQVVWWGSQQQQQLATPAPAGPGGAGPPATAREQASSAVVPVPAAPEVERARQLLCLQAGGNGMFLLARLRDEAAAAAAPPPQTHSASGGSGPMPASSSADASGHYVGRRLHPAAFGVLADALDAIVVAAAAREDFGALASCLELSMCFYMHSGSGTKVRLLEALSRNPYLTTSWLWAGVLAARIKRLGGGAGAGAGSEGGAWLWTGGGAPDTPPAGRPASQHHVLQYCLEDMATWLMYLGMRPDGCWRLLAGLAASCCGVPADAVADATGPPALAPLLQAVRAALQRAKGDARHRHRHRMAPADSMPYLHHSLPTYPLSLSQPPAPQQQQQQASAAITGDGLNRPGFVAPTTQLTPLANNITHNSSSAHAPGSAHAAAEPEATPRSSNGTLSQAWASHASPQQSLQCSSPQSPGMAAAAGPATPGGALASPATTAMSPLGPSPSSVGRRARAVGGYAAAAAVAAATAALAVNSPPPLTDQASSLSVAASERHLEARASASSLQMAAGHAVSSSAASECAYSAQHSKRSMSGRYAAVAERKASGRASRTALGSTPAAEPTPRPEPGTSLTLDADGPVAALAASMGVVAAATPYEPCLHLLSCKDGCLSVRAKVQLPVAGATPCGVRAVALSPDAATAVVLAPGGSGMALSRDVSPPRDASPRGVAGCRLGPGWGDVVRLVDVEQLKVKKELAPAHSGRVTCVSFSASGNLLATACAASTVRMWDVRLSSVRAGPAVAVHSQQGGVSTLLLDGGRPRLYTGGRDGSVKAWDLRKTAAPLQVHLGHSDWVTGLSLLPHHHSHGLLVSSSLDWTARTWDLGGSSSADGVSSSSSALCGVLLGHGGGITALASVTTELAPAPCILTGARDGCIGVWTARGELLHMLRYHGGAVQLLQPTSGGFASAGQDGSTAAWRWASDCTSKAEAEEEGGGGGDAWLRALPLLQEGSRERRCHTHAAVVDQSAQAVVLGLGQGVVQPWQYGGR